MHLHSLRIQAFGPFGGETCVDFDVLTQAGLFLFTGPTGSGKSSVLDAVCFALYGVVPGTRHAARQLRSDHAGAGVPPEVELSFSIESRRFRIRRSPAWERPKRRGRGLTTQQASVLVEEQQGDTWHTLTTRLDDAGDLVVRLLGMQPGQFTQVAMLPQGEFQKFLGARSDDRQAILQRLFRTDRFAQVERWVRDRCLSVARTSTTHHTQVEQVLSRVQEVTSAELPPAWGDHDLALLVGQGAVTRWCEELRDRTAASLTSAVSAAGEHDERWRQAVIVHDEAQAVVSAVAEGRRAERALARLESSADDAHHQQSRLERHRRALPVLVLGRRQAEAQAELEAASEIATALLSEVGLDDGTTLPQARDRHRRAQRRLHSVEEFLPRQDLLDRALVEAVEARSSLARTADEITTLETALGQLPERRESAAADVLAARLSEQDLTRVDAELAAAQQAVAAAKSLALVEARLASTAQDLLAATAHHQRLRERHQDLREARINAMAGELAAGLAAGCSCPVCGSPSHPAPASPEVGASRDDEDQARAAVDDAAIGVEALRDAVRTLEHERGVLWGQCGGLDLSACATVLEQAEEARAAAASSAAGKARAEEELAALTTQETQLRADLADLRLREAALDSSVSALQATIEELRLELRRVLDGVQGDDVRAVHRSLGREVTQLQRVVGALEVVETAQADARRCLESAHTEALAAGFADWPAAQAALLPRSEADRIERLLLDREREDATARATMARPEVAAALSGPTPALADLRAAVTTSERQRDVALADLQRWETQAARLDLLDHELVRATDAWLPVLRQHERLSGLADLLEGRSADNGLRMRLSAYVLSERLRGVVDAANDRLGRMGVDRFTLEQSDEASGRDRRGGLALRVRDAWTSSVRDPGTLSGGETFMVSLALALGLADTVTAESGGTRIETLFIDEGFGSLDADALEGVLDTLDSLREGGRAVGVVSHVTEMRERIPTQVQVTARPDGGSSLQIVVGD